MNEYPQVRSARAAALPSMRAERVLCALQDRVMGLGAPGGERLWRGILLNSGAASVEIGEEVLPLSSPCLAWIPWRPGRTLRIRAGAVG